MDLCQVFVALVYISLWSSQTDHITLAAGLWERDLDLVEFVPDLLDLSPSSSNHGFVEALLDQDITGLLIFLKKNPMNNQG